MPEAPGRFEARRPGKEAAVLLACALTIGGVLLVGWGVRARRGRSERARAWSRGFEPRHALFGWPAGGAAVIGAGLIAADGPLGVGLIGLLLFAGGMLALFVLDILGAPYPASWAPAWARPRLAVAAGAPAPWPVPVPPPDVPEPWRALRDRIAQSLASLPVGAALAVSEDGTSNRRHVLFHHDGDAISIETSDATTDYRLDVAIGAGVDETTARILASHGVGALAAIGGTASHAWRVEPYA